MSIATDREVTKRLCDLRRRAIVSNAITTRPPLMAEPPNVRLELASRPENVMLVREVLTGVAEAQELDSSDLIDIHTAVTEACNNVVLHAYTGEGGPLGVVVELQPTAIEVAVRDWGRGIPPPGRAGQGAEPGIGLTAIRALTHRFELRCPSDGGTEIWMEFATLDPRAPEPSGEQRPIVTPLAPTAHGPMVTVTLAPANLGRTVLPRLLSGLAARAHLSTDRLADTHLIADALGSTGAASLRIAAGTEPHALELRIGPLERGQAKRLIAESTLDGLGSVIAKLVDRHRVESAGFHEVLALRLGD